MHTDENLAWPDGGLRSILVAEDAGSAEFVEADCLFGVSAFGTDLGLRIMEGLGLVAVT